MKRLSRLTALLLALVLMLSSGLSAVAESITTKEQYFAAASDALQKFIMGTETYEEYWAIAKLIEEDIFDEFYAGLTTIEQQEMATYVEGMFWDSLILFDNVAPFMPVPAVEEDSGSSTFSVLSRSGESDIATVDDSGSSATENGLILAKNAVENDDGTYTVTLETYVTGVVTTTTTTVAVPCDIVLVLDFSNSMSQSFDGSGGGHGSSSSSSDSKIVGLQTAVNDFIQSVNDNYSETGKHRISIVSYNTNAETRNGWTYASDANVSDLQISDDERDEWQGQGTNTHLGLEAAKTLITSSGSGDGRQKIVILFTDGVPGTSGSNSFTESAAVSAVANAKSLKDAGATVYSIAVLNGADPTATIDTSATTNTTKINAMLHAISSNYPSATASYSGDTYYTSLGTINPLADVDNSGAIDSDNDKSYYLSADSADSLSNIFQSISSSVQSGTSSLNLGSNTVIQDVISPYFKLPEGATTSDIVVTEATYEGEVNGVKTWGTPTASNATVSFVSTDTENKTIQVTGFNFSSNAVMTVNNQPQGKKLIITFDVEPEDDFIGGNQVITNNQSASGVYTPNTDGSLSQIEQYPLPDVDNVVKIIKPIIKDDYIYISNAADLTKLIGREGDYYTYTLTYYTENSDGSLTLGETTGPWKIDGVNNAYVDITYTFKTSEEIILADGKTKIAAGTVLATMSIPHESSTGTLVYTDAGNSIDWRLVQDTSIQVVCDVVPTEEGDYQASQNVQTPAIFVYKPVVTFVDEAVEYNKPAGMDAETFYNEKDWLDTLVEWEGNYRDSDGNIVSGGTVKTTVDADNQTVAQVVATVDGVEKVIDNMSGDEPELTMKTYAATTENGAAYTWLDEENNNLVIGEEDVYVNVTEVVSTNADGTAMDITGYTKRIRLDCNVDHGCDHTDETAYIINGTNADPDFVIHIYNVYGQLTITKLVDGEPVPDTLADAEFTFTVSLKHKAADATEATSLTNLPYTKGTLADDKNTVGDDASNPSGTVSDGDTIKLKAGETATIWNLPPETEYSVTETPVAGFVPSNDGDTAGSIAAGETSTEIFTNTYSPEPLRIVKKIVDANGNDVTDANVGGDAFTFRISNLEDGTYTCVYDDGRDNETFTIDDSKTYHDVTIYGAGSVTINSILFGTNYKVTEIVKPDAYDYYSVEDSKMTGEAVVKSDSEFSVAGTIEDGGNEVTFKNQYVTGTLTIDKVVTGSDSNTLDDEFTVKVQLPEGTYNVNGTSTFFDGTLQTLTQKLTENTSIVITGIPRGAAYTVEEVTDAANLPVGYDATAVAYENQTGTVAAAGTTATITNSYAKGNLEITKTVVNDFIDGDTFVFTVTLPAGSFDYTVVNADEVQQESGKISDHEQIVLQDGWKATITGIPAGAGYKVDETNRDEYSTTAIVTGDNSATFDETTLAVEGTIPAGATASAAFTNTHKTGSLAISKTVMGAEVSADEKFRFAVTVNYGDDVFAGTFTAVRTTSAGTTTESVEFINAAANVWISNSETLTISGLPFGATYGVVEHLTTAQNGYYTKTNTVYVDNGTPDTIDADKTDSVSVTNTRSNETLTITKTVLNAYGEEDLNTNEAGSEFEFFVELTAPSNVTLESSYKYAKGTVGNATEGESGAEATKYDLECNDDGLYGPVYLKSGEYITIEGLPVGAGYKVTETVQKTDAGENVFVTTSTGAEDTITKGTPATAAFTNQHKFGYLKFNKVVDANGYDLSELTYVEDDFVFAVYLPAGSYTYTLNGTANTLTVDAEKGYGEITLKNGQTAMITLPPDIDYTITENVPAGFVCKADGVEKTSVSGTISAAETAEHAFVNTYTPASLQIIKNIADPDGKLIAYGGTDSNVTVDPDINVNNDVFTFEVTIENLEKGSYPIVKGGTVESTAIQGNYFVATGNDSTVYTIKITGAGYVSINAIPFASDVNFTVTEVESLLQDGYTDCTITTSNATADATDKYKASGTLNTAKQVAVVAYTNTYTTGSLTVNKEIIDAYGNNVTADGDSNIANHEFEINVVGLPAGWYTYTLNGTTLTQNLDGDDNFYIKGTGSLVIEGIPVDTEYTVTEVESSLPTGYHLKYLDGVEEKEASSGSIDADGESVTVTNTYSTGSLGITKTVLPHDYRDDEFTFTIALKDKTGQDLTGTYLYKIDEDVQDNRIGNGSVIKLEDGETATIEGLPDGATYTVTETEDADYSTTKTGDTGTIVAKTTKMAAFTNTHHTGALKIEKTVPNVTSTQPFEFEVYVEFEGEPLKNGTYGGVTFENGKATVYVTAGSSKIIEELPAGAIATVTETVNASYTTEPASLEATATIPNESNATVSFTNTHVLGNLEISKTVVPVNGYELSDTEGQAELPFTFTVTLVNNNNVALAGQYDYTKVDANDAETTGKVYVGADGKVTLDADGETTITLKHDEQIRIMGLPVGTMYTVAEADDSAYETTVSKNGAEPKVETDAGITGTVDADGESIAYTNSHKPGFLKVTKSIIVPMAVDSSAEDSSSEIEGDLSDIPDEIDKEFTFYVLFYDEEGNELSDDHLFDWYKNGTKQAEKIGNGGTFILGNDEHVIIEGLLPGTQYSVWETPEYGYIRSCTITDECDPATENKIDAGKTDTVAYTNTYNPETLVIRKKITGDDANSANDVFYFDVTLPISDTPYILSDDDAETGDKELYFTEEKKTHTLSITGEGSLAISGIPLYYAFTVEESVMPNGYSFTTAEPMQYDESNQLVADERTITRVSGTQVDSAISYRGNEVVFTNTYTTGELDVTKNVIGLIAPKDTEGNFAGKFTFEVNFYTDSTKNKLQEGTFGYTIKDADGNAVENGSGEIKNGTGSFKLMHGQTATFTGIPAETYYTVTETPDNNYTTNSTGDEGTISTTKAEAVFTNSYNYGRLTIDKSFAENVYPEEDETFLFHVSGPDGFSMDVVIEGDDKITLNHLPVGNYTVTEDTSWSWRYYPVDKDVTKEAKVEAGEIPVVEFTNDRIIDEWLEGNAYADNIFKGSSNAGDDDDASNNE